MRDVTSGKFEAIITTVNSNITTGPNFSKVVSKAIMIFFTGILYSIMDRHTTMSTPTQRGKSDKGSYPTKKMQDIEHGNAIW